MRRATYLAKLNHYIAQGFAIVYIYARGFESETIRRYGYAPIGSPCIDRYTGKPKIEPMSLVRSMAKCYLHSIA